MKFRLLIASAVAPTVFSLCAASYCTAATCGDLKSASAEDAIRYIQTAAANHVPERCVYAAYDIFSPRPPDEKIPILLKLLSARIPLESETIISASRSTLPDFFYPAAGVLIDLGQRAEPAVLDYIATDPYRDTIAWQNAVFVYLMSQTQRISTIHAILSIKAQRAELTDVAAKARLSDAIQFIVKRYCGGPESTAACEAAANSH